MTDAGMFDKIIGALMKKVGNNVVGVALMTCLIAIIGHLDGGGASTFLITIPAMLPVYKRLHMRRETLLLICVTAMGVMNLMPWGGPTMRAASVIEMEPNDLWFQKKRRAMAMETSSVPAARSRMGPGGKPGARSARTMARRQTMSSPAESRWLSRS